METITILTRGDFIQKGDLYNSDMYWLEVPEQWVGSPFCAFDGWIIRRNSQKDEGHSMQPEAGTSAEADSSCLTVSANCQVDSARPQADASPNLSQSKICPFCNNDGYYYDGFGEVRVCGMCQE